MVDSEEISIETMESRFDADLLTSCLTFYKARVTNLSLETVGGTCEDSVNFLNSEGTVAYLEIDSSFEDSLDMDFSTIEIRELLVTNSGNDCLDLSDGTYKIFFLEAIGCLDKAISIGERAQVEIETAHLQDSAVGIAVKDSAGMYVLNAKVKNATVCLAGYRKKQEFGGANLSINPAACESGPTIFQNGSLLTYTTTGSVNE